MKFDHRSFEIWARRRGMRPICRVAEKHGDVLIADSGTPLVEPTRSFYRTAFAIDRGICWIASDNETDISDPEMRSRTQRGAQEYRVNEALAYARKLLVQTHQSGLYEVDGRFSKRPS